MNIDSRKRFRESEHGKSWHDTVMSNAYASAVETAMVVTQQALPPAPDMATAAANDWRMQGARLFAKTLSDLTEVAPEQPKTTVRKLNYKV